VSLLIREAKLTVREAPAGGSVGDKVDDQSHGGLHGCGQVVVLVHGFNNDEREAADSYSAFVGRFRQKLSQANMAIDGIGCFRSRVTPRKFRMPESRRCGCSIF
jgi:hypothetical protein